MMTLLLSQVELANAYSEKFPITNGTTVRSIELEKGDRVVGNITITNIPYPSGIIMQLSVWIEYPDGERLAEVILKIINATERFGQFNFTASYSGIYKIKIYYQYVEWRLPIVHLQYTIKKVHTDTSSDTSSTSFPSFNLQGVQLYLILGVIACLLVGAIIYKLVKH